MPRDFQHMHCPTHAGNKNKDLLNLGSVGDDGHGDCDDGDLK